MTVPNPRPWTYPRKAVTAMHFLHKRLCSGVNNFTNRRYRRTHNTSFGRNI